MSKLLFENKQLTHVGVEVLVLIVLTFYFNSKISRLQNVIKELSQHIQEQETILEKHEQLLKQLAASPRQAQPAPVPPPVRNKRADTPNLPNPSKTRQVPPPRTMAPFDMLSSLLFAPAPAPAQPRSSGTVQVVEENEDDSLPDGLENEIRDELDELQDNGSGSVSVKENVD